MVIVYNKFRIFGYLKRDFMLIYCNLYNYKILIRLILCFFIKE